jgi:hypothetical protein
MSDMRVRIEVEIFDEQGESHTLVGASKRINPSGNPLWFARKFDELAAVIQADIRAQLVLKHGGGKS